MKTHRIYAIVLRHTFNMMHNIGHFIAPFYWPLIDVLMWGLTGYFVRTFAQGNLIYTILISGAVMWLITHRFYFDFAVSIIYELWDRNLINLFASPLSVTEWVIGILVFSLIRVILSFLFISLFAFLLYTFNIYTFGLYLIPFAFLLLLNGLWLGFLIGGLIVRYGQRVEVFVWTSMAFISPFSAVFYPVSVLPWWGKAISSILPTSYVFEGIRGVMQKGTMNQELLIVSFSMTVLYIFLSVLYFRYSFRKTLENGLINVY